MRGGGVCNSGTFVFQNGIIENCTAETNGGGIYNTGTLTIINGTVTGCSAGNHGGGIFANSSTVDINGGSIDNNNAVMSVGKNFGCGGIFVYYNEYYKYTDDVAVNIKNANISQNTAEGNGGGIYTENAKASVDIKNSTIGENKSSKNGGAIYVCDNAKAELTTTKITANTTNFGGGVCCDTDKMYLNGGIEIFGNLVQSDENQNAIPGNLYLMNQNTVTVNKSEIQTDTGNVDTKIGVTIDGGTGEITPPNDTDYGKCFLSDLSDYCVDTADNGIVKLVKAYTVTFDDGSGTINSVSVKENETVSEIAEPIKNGYTFGGWFDGENGFDFSKPITKHVTLTAKWLTNSGNAVSITPNKIYVSNNGTAAKVYVAAYKDGKLTDAYMTDITASTRKNISEINLNVTGADKISIFMWDNNMNPLCIGASTELN